jgi:pimeloyl-ACP methyl ester carboxylesterase
MEPLGRFEAPVLVVGSRDEADPSHPLATAREYAARLPRGRLVVEEPGEAPLAWRGGRVSEAIADFLDYERIA